MTYSAVLLLGLYAKAARLRNVLGHGEGVLFARCAVVLGHGEGVLFARCAVALRDHVEEGFAERALRLLDHGCCGVRAGLPDCPVCAQGLPVHGRAGQHKARLQRSTGAAVGREALL